MKAKLTHEKKEEAGSFDVNVQRQRMRIWRGNTWPKILQPVTARKFQPERSVTFRWPFLIVCCKITPEWDELENAARFGPAPPNVHSASELRPAEWPGFLENKKQKILLPFPVSLFCCCLLDVCKYTTMCGVLRCKWLVQCFRSKMVVGWILRRPATVDAVGPCKKAVFACLVI